MNPEVVVPTEGVRAATFFPAEILVEDLRSWT